MVDFDKLIVSRLRELSLPVYYDYCLDETNEAPCISYYQYDNNAYANGDTLGYSKIIYKIKVWNKNPDNLSSYSTEVDTIMRSLGFKRTNSNELWVNNLGCKELKYENYAIEDF